MAHRHVLHNLKDFHVKPYDYDYHDCDRYGYDDYRFCNPYMDAEKDDRSPILDLSRRKVPVIEQSVGNILSFTFLVIMVVLGYCFYRRVRQEWTERRRTHHTTGARCNLSRKSRLKENVNELGIWGSNSEGEGRRRVHFNVYSGAASPNSGNKGEVDNREWV